MAPLPVQLSSAVASTRIPPSTLSTFYLAAHTLTTSRVSPIATSWHTGPTVSKRWDGGSLASRDDDDDAGWKTVGDNDDDGDYITVAETPASESAPTSTDENDDGDAGDETSINETSDEPASAPTGEGDDEAAGWKTTGDDDTSGEFSDDKINDSPTPVETVGTEASADTITSELLEKYGAMPTSIDDCIDTEDETVTYTDENGNNTVTINCTALANMETWYFLPCDDECHDDLDKIIPGVVVGSGVSGGLLPTILNNHALWGNNPVSQTAIVNWLTTHLQNIRSLLSTEVFDWTRVQSNAEELMSDPPVNLPLENDAFPASEGVPEPATPEAIENAEDAVEEASNALENLKHMTKDPDALRAAEERLAHQQEVLRQLKKNGDPTQAPNEEVLPEDPVEPIEPFEPVEPVDPTDRVFSPEEIEALKLKLGDAVRAVNRANRSYKATKGNPTIPRREQMALRNRWVEAKKAVKDIRDLIHENKLPIDDIPEMASPEETPRWSDAEIETSKQAVKKAKEALREARGRTSDGDVIEALEQAAKNAADVARYHKDNVYEVKPKKTVEEAQNQLDEIREISDKGEEQLRALDEDLQNMIDNIPEGPPEAVEAYQKGLKNIEDLKQSTTEYMAKVAKDLLTAERALKRANGELKVTWPDDPVDGEQEHPYGPDRVYENEGPSDLDGANDDDEPTGDDEWHDADETKDGEEPTEPDQPTETNEPEIDEPTKPSEETEADEKTEINEPTETEPTETNEPTKTDEKTEVDEPTESDGKSDDNEPSDDGESIEIEVLPPGGAPIVPPGVFPPMVIPIPGVGDVTAPTKVLQEAAGALKEAAEWLLNLNDKDNDEKEHRAIKKAEKKIKEAKKKLKKEQEKEKKKQEKEEKKQDKADKKDKDEKSTTKPTKAKATSTSTTSSKTSKTPEPTVHHDQHEAEITFHGEHKHKFELYGKDWARGKNDADKLHDNMENCGMKIKDWEFTYAEDKPEIKTSDWSFYAKGELLRKTAADVRCLNKVIHEANGPKDLISETDGVDKTGDAPDKAEVAAQVTFSDKHFTLYGKGFAKDKDAGEKLKDKMGKCSKIKDWKFYTQKNDHDMKLKEQGWDFYAEGAVKDVKRKCLNEAIQGMGGPVEAIADGDV